MLALQQPSVGRRNGLVRPIGHIKISRLTARNCRARPDCGRARTTTAAVEKPQPVEKPLRAHYPGRGAYPVRLGPPVRPPACLPARHRPRLGGGSGIGWPHWEARAMLRSERAGAPEPPGPRRRRAGRCSRPRRMHSAGSSRSSVPSPGAQSWPRRVSPARTCPTKQRLKPAHATSSWPAGPLPLLHAGGRQPPAEAGRAGAQIAAAGAPLCAPPPPRLAPLRWPAARAGAVAPPSPPAAVFVRGEGAAGAGAGRAGARIAAATAREREGWMQRVERVMKSLQHNFFVF